MAEPKSINHAAERIKSQLERAGSLLLVPKPYSGRTVPPRMSARSSPPCWTSPLRKPTTCRPSGISRPCHEIG
jgi:hypothetical protein